MISCWSQGLRKKKKCLYVHGCNIVRQSVFSHSKGAKLLQQNSLKDTEAANNSHEDFLKINERERFHVWQDACITPFPSICLLSRCETAKSHQCFRNEFHSELWTVGRLSVTLGHGSLRALVGKLPARETLSRTESRNVSGSTRKLIISRTGFYMIHSDARDRVSGKILNRRLGESKVAKLHTSSAAFNGHGKQSVLSSGQNSSRPSSVRGQDLWDSYDPEAIARYYRWRPLPVVLRAASIISEIAMLRIWRYLEPDINKRAIKGNDTGSFGRVLFDWARFMSSLREQLGQALSTRPDVLPGAYCRELAKLQDQIPPFATPVALSFLEAELGAPPSQLFQEISAEPVAAASLGQVYKVGGGTARLPSGEHVAVKVQRPGLVDRLALDAHLLRVVAAPLQHYLQARSDFVGLVDETMLSRLLTGLGSLACQVGRMFEEVDYTREGRNAERFAALYASNSTDRSADGGKVKRKTGGGKAGVKVPAIFWNQTTRRVLTMEWIDGIKLTDHVAIKEANLNVQQLVDQGVMCSLQQLLEEGFFHADPHPGNLVVTREGQLVYFDFGMMSDMRREYRVGLIRTLVHFVNRDAVGLAKDFEILGFLPPGADLDKITEALRESFAAQGSRANMDFQGIMMQLSSVMYEFRFRLPPEFAMVIRALGSLEGTATSLDPSFKVVASAYPFIVGRLLVEAGPEMRMILRELLIRPNGTIRWHRLERLVIAITEQTRLSETGSPIRKHESSAIDTLAGVGLRGAFDRRAVVAAAADLIDFILSDSGIMVRVGIVRDIVRAADTAFQESLYASSQLRSGLKLSTNEDDEKGGIGGQGVGVDRGAKSVGVEVWGEGGDNRYDKLQHTGHLERGNVSKLSNPVTRLKERVDQLSGREEKGATIANVETEGGAYAETAEGSRLGEDKGVETRDHSVETTTELEADFRLEEGSSNENGDSSTNQQNEPQKFTRKGQSTKQLEALNGERARERLASGFQATAQSLRSAPELWLPLLVRTVAQKEAQAMGAAVLGGVAECCMKATADGSWVVLSKWLREADS